MRRQVYKDLPDHKRLPYIFFTSKIKMERPEVQPHAKTCPCRRCKKYAKLFAQLERMQKGRKES